MKISATPFYIPLRSTFKQASFTRKAAESVRVDIQLDDQVGLGEGTPRSYVTAENVPGAVAWINEQADSIANQCTDLEGTKSFIAEHNAQIDKHPAAWCAVELALLDAFARQKKESVESLLGVSDHQNNFYYTAVLGDDEPEVFVKKAARFKAIGFKQYKMKLSGDIVRDLQHLDILHDQDILNKAALRVDANNLWGDDLDAALKFFGAFSAELLGIEEPFSAKRFDLISALSRQTKTPVILDESATQVSDLPIVTSYYGSFILNIKVSKVGGVLRAIDMVNKAKELRMPIIVGAHVGETSILTRAAMLVARAAGKNLIGHEGGFGEYLLEKDVVEPVLQIGAAGKIDLSAIALEHTGWGLQRRI
jgi:L-alanine-DL-glutamate epimerase-like enolase superfamily enzyme